MSERYYVWFLEAGIAKEAYAEQLADVEALMLRNAWRAIYTVAVDFRQWDEGHLYWKYFKTFESGWYGTKQPEWDYFAEINGKINQIVERKGVKWIRFQYGAKPTNIIEIPIKAVVSSCSCGFPKVAYSAEQYLVGYMQWLSAFEFFISEHGSQSAVNHLTNLKPEFLSENFPAGIWNQMELLMVDLENSVHHPWTDATIARLTASVESLRSMMIDGMRKDFASRNKPPYHHIIEWQIDQTILRSQDPLILAYMELRRAYPSVIVGNAFIEVPPTKPDQA